MRLVPVSPRGLVWKSLINLNYEIHIVDQSILLLILRHLLEVFWCFQGASKENVCASGGKRCSFSGNFGVFCCLVIPVLRFVLLRYYRRLVFRYWNILLSCSMTPILNLQFITKLFSLTDDRTILWDLQGIAPEFPHYNPR